MNGEEIIALILKDLGIKAPTFAKEIGVLYSRVQDVQSGKVKKISSDVEDKIIHRYPKFDLSWLLSGEGSPYSEEVAEAKPQGIPLLPYMAMAGALTGDIPGVTLRSCETFVLPNIQADFLMMVQGDSMEPTYRPGDIVACRFVREPRFIQWHRAYVIDSEQGPLIKRLEMGSDESKVTFVSENQKYTPFELDKAEVRNIALVVGLIRAE